MPELDALLWPRSIAVVGASPDPAIIRGRLLATVRRHGFPGPLYPVSRSHAAIRGLACYPSVEALPEAVDLAIITIPAIWVPEVLEACGRRGIRAAYIISSGFAEEASAEGAARQRAVAETAARYDMAVCGPNAEGFLNTRLPLAASFSPTLAIEDEASLPAPGRSGQIAVVSQSGGIGFAFYDRGRPKALRFSYVLTTGNEAGVDCLDLLDYLIDDAHTHVVLLFLEAFRRPDRFAAIAARAARARKPLVVAKMGRSEAGVRAVVSHTASLAGSYRGYRAVLRHHGAALAEEADEMVDIGAGFAYFRDRLPKGKRVGVLTASGGAGIWLAEACAGAGLTVAELDAETRAALDALLPPYGNSRNPVDITAQTVFRFGYARPLEILAASAAVDAVVVACSVIRAELIEADIDQLRRLGETTAKPILFCAYTRAMPRAVELLAGAGFPCLSSTTNCARAVAAMADYHAFLDRRNRDPGPPAPLAAAVGERLAAGGPVLCEYQAKSVLAAAGIEVSEATLATTADEAAAAAARLRGPVALKLQSPDIPHKTEAGGVALDLVSAKAVRAAFERVTARARAFDPGAAIHGALVEPMAPAGVEMILGVRTDPDFGPLVMVGMGGVLVELLDDVALAPVPIGPGDASALLDRLRGRRLLDGVRGAAPADTDALVALMVALSRLAAGHGGTIAEIDLNPVIVHPRGHGLSIADALMLTRPQAERLRA